MVIEEVAIDGDRCLFLDEQYNALAMQLRWEKSIRDSQSERHSRRSKRREAHNGEAHNGSEVQLFESSSSFSNASAEETHEVGKVM